MSQKVSPWRAAWRAVRILGHVLRGLWIIRTEFGRLNASQTELVVREWTRQMLGLMGVSLSVQGEVPRRGPLLLVANHISWLDILVMNATQPARFVSKADVQRWPLLGTLISSAGTLYIERESRRDAMRVVHKMAERLRANDLLAVFPEGTTGDGQALLPFHANVLQAAIAAAAPVLPLAVRYSDALSGERSDAPLFIGDTTLVASIWRTLRANGLTAQLVYGQAQHADGRERRAWAADLQAEVGRLQQIAITSSCAAS